MTDRYTINPATIAALTHDQKIVLRAAIELDAALPATSYPIAMATAYQLADVADMMRVHPNEAATTAVETLWVAGFLDCYSCTNAANADHTFTAYQLSRDARRERSWIARLLAHELDGAGGGQ